MVITQNRNFEFSRCGPLKSCQLAKKWDWKSFSLIGYRKSVPQRGLSFEKMKFFAKNFSFSFIKWKPLTQETWFLSHSIGNFVDHFFVTSRRFVDIQHFPWPDMIRILKSFLRNWNRLIKSFLSAFRYNTLTFWKITWWYL